MLDGEVFDDGAIGLLLGPEAGIETVVSQGCRPIGQPYVVTRGERNLIHELGGRPALERLQEIVEGLDASERSLVQRGLHLGIVVNEHKLDFGRGDFLVRGVLGLERQSRALAVGDVVETGTTVQFQVRDAASARQDLRGLMAGRCADGALLFTCNGRGRRLFEVADQDASVGGRRHRPGAAGRDVLRRRDRPCGPAQLPARLHGVGCVVRAGSGAVSLGGLVQDHPAPGVPRDRALEQRAIEVIRGLAMDAPHAARSGHQGTAMALAPLAHVLWSRIMTFDPAAPDWPDRDRFVLSAGHASILLYSMAYLCGYDLTLEDLKAFRQWGSRTPGPPRGRDRHRRGGHHRSSGPGFRQRRGDGAERALAAHPATAPISATTTPS